MEIRVSLFLLFFVFISSCSKSTEKSNVSTSGVKPLETAASNPQVNLQNAPTPTVESKSTPNPKDVVRFDGTNYIKKSGWKVPSRNDTYVDDTYDQGNVKRMTENGKQVEMKTVNYLYKAPWLYSQDFYFEGRELDYMKGSLSAGHFFEMSVNGKVFMYTIGGNEKVVPPPGSNSDPHKDPFGYQIMDKDGDGIFETLLGPFDEIIVPNWVLK